MRKKIISLFLAVVLCAASFLNVSGSYRPGEITYSLVSTDCTKSEGVSISSDNHITASGQGTAQYDFFLTFDAEKVEFLYEAGSSGKISASFANGETAELPLSGESESVIYTFKSPLRLGDQIVDFSFEGDMVITEIKFHEKDTKFTKGKGGKEIYLVNLSDEEWAISTAVLVKTDASIIMVNGSRRYIDEQDLDTKPLVVDGSIYLPIKPLARALEYYYEDIPSKNYILMRQNDVNYEWRDGVMTRQELFGEAEVINVTPKFVDGKTYLPLRYFAEERGETVLFKDGLAVVDYRNIAERIIEDNKVFDHAMKEFEPFKAETTVGNTYYVAQSFNASDSNPGTIDAPFKTLNKAGSVAQAGDTVIIREGVYREIFEPKNDGTETSPITFRAMEGEEVVFSATEEVKDFVDMGDGTVAGYMDWDLGLGKNQVFYNNECIIEARYPNSPPVKMAEGRELSDLYPVKGDFLVTDNDKTTVVSDTLLNQTEKDYWKGAIYVSMHGHGYGLGTAVVDSSEQGKLHLTKFSTYKWWDPAFSDHADFGFLSGHKNAMDLPGEWIKEENVLIMVPPEGETAKTLKVEVKKRQIVADLENRKFVHLEGIKIFGGSIRMNNSEMCMLDGIEGKYLNHFTWSDDFREGFIDDYSVAARTSGKPSALSRGEVGIIIGGTDNYVINSKLDHAASAAIVMVGTYAYIENNIISNTGYAGNYVSGVSMMTEPWKDARTPRGGFALYNNTIYNAGRSVFNMSAPEGIPGEWNNPWHVTFLPHEMAYNDFHDGILFSLDTGVTYEYYSVAESERANARYHHNLVYVTFPESNPFSMGLYHDGYTKGFDTYENIVFTTEPETIFTHSYTTTSSDGSITDNMARRNMDLYREPVPGGAENLEAKHYPLGMPFYAGAYLDRGEYLANYNKEGQAVELLDVKDAVLGGDVALNEYGYAELNSAGDYIEFKNVDFTEEGKNTIDIYYAGDFFKGNTILQIGVGDSIETAQFTPQKFEVRTRGFEEIDLYKAYFSETTGTQNVYIKYQSGPGVNIDSIYLRKNAAGSVGLDGAKVWGGEFNRIVKVQNSVVPNIISATANGKPYVKDVWPGSELLYNKVNVPEGAKVFYVNAGVSGIYAGQEIAFSYYKTGDPENTEFARVVTQDIGWNTDNQPIYVDLTDMPSGEMDIYVEFFTNGKTCNLFSFGFLTEMPEEAAN